MKKSSKLFINILLLVFIVALAIYLGRAGTKESTSNVVDKTGDAPDKIAENIEQEEIAGTIYFLTDDTEGSDIVSYKLADKSKKTVFTDKDEELKIKQAQSIKDDGSEILMVLGEKAQQFGGSLWLVSASGNGKKDKIIDDFASPIGPVLSPDGKKIAYTVFSNLESEIGFNLIVADKNGENKAIIAQDSINISLPVFSPDGKNIYYLKNKNIIKSNLDDDGKEQVLSIKDQEIVYSISAGEKGKLAFVIGPQGNNVLNKTEVYYRDPSSKNLVRLTDNDLQEVNLQFSPDGQKLAFLEIKQDGAKENPTKSGSINLIDIESKKKQSIDLEANKLIGWIK